MDAMDLLASRPSYRRMLERTGQIAPRPRAAPDDADVALPEEEQQSMLNDLARRGYGALDTIGRIWDTPGAIARGALTGDISSGFNWDQEKRVTGKEMLEQAGLLRKDADPFYAHFAGFAAELLTDPLAIAQLPLRALTGAGRAAKAAGVLDYAQDAAMAKMGMDRASKTLRTGRSSYEWLGNLLPAGKAITKENAHYRPLVGPRVARSSVTLDETLKAIPDAAKQEAATQGVMNYLKKRGISYDDVKDQNLGGAFGLEYFGMFDPIVFNPKSKIVQGALDMLDNAGQKINWSGPVRALSALTSKRVGGKVDAYQQLSNMKHWDELQGRLAAGRVASAGLVRAVTQTPLNEEARKILGTDSLATEQGRDFLTRLWEDVPTQSDMRLRSIIGESNVDKLVKAYGDITDEIGSTASKLGMVQKTLNDPFGGKWLSRRARELEFGEYGKGGSNKEFYSRSLENEARNPNLSTPGMTVDSRQLSVLPEVQQWVTEGEKSGLTEEQIGAAIKKFIDLKHGPDTPQARAYLEGLGLQYDPLVRTPKSRIPQLGPDGKPLMQQVIGKSGKPVMVRARDEAGNIILDTATGKPQMVPKMRTVKSTTEFMPKKQAEGAARVMMRLDPRRAGEQLFSEHPLVSVDRAVLGQARAAANAQTVYRSIGEGAVYAGAGKRSNTLPGINWKPAGKALDEAAKAAGLSLDPATGRASQEVQDILRSEIALRNNKDISEINLDEWGVPEKVLNRLTAVADFVSRPRAVESVMQVFGKLNDLYKGFLLAFPAKFTRDAYSNAYQSLLLTGGNPFDVIYGLRASTAILAGRTDEAAALLKEIPSYDLPSVDAVQRTLTNDVARTGVMQGMSSADITYANPTGVLNALAPGTNPMRAGDFLKELMPDGSRSPRQMVADYFTIRDLRIPGLQKYAPTQTKNAILNASQQVGEYIDGTFRLGTMLALMRRGISADEAARRVAEAMVDYNSLTQVEKVYFKGIFSWWSYSSRAGAFAAKQLVQNPGGIYAQTIRGFNRFQESDEKTYVPEALRQSFAIRVSDDLKQALGIGKSDSTTFVRDFDIPGHDVLSLFQPGWGIYRPLRGTMQNLAQQTNPLIQAGIELATDQDLFSRRPLLESDSSIDRIYRALFRTKENMDPAVRQMIELIPGPRVSGPLGTLIGPRTPTPLNQRVLKTVANTLSGVKFQDVDRAYQLSDAMRILSEDFGTNMRKATRSFIPKDIQPNLSPEEMKKWILYQSLDKQLREMRKPAEEPKSKGRRRLAPLMEMRRRMT